MNLMSVAGKAFAKSLTKQVKAAQLLIGSGQNNFLSGIEKFIGIVLGKKVPVRPGPAACTTGDVIYLPPQELNDEGQLVYLGKALHELSHILIASDFEHFKAVQREEHGALKARLINTTDDIRVEMGLQRKYPRVVNTTRPYWQWKEANVLSEIDSPKMLIADLITVILNVGVLFIARCRFRQLGLTMTFQPNPLVCQVYDTYFAELEDEALAQVVYQDSVNLALKLYERIKDMIRDDIAPPSAPSQPQQGDDSDEDGDPQPGQGSGSRKQDTEEKDDQSDSDSDDTQESDGTTGKSGDEDDDTSEDAGGPGEASDGDEGDAKDDDSSGQDASPDEDGDDTPESGDISDEDSGDTGGSGEKDTPEEEGDDSGDDDTSTDSSSDAGDSSDDKSDDEGLEGGKDGDDSPEPEDDESGSDKPSGGSEDESNTEPDTESDGDSDSKPSDSDSADGAEEKEGAEEDGGEGEGKDGEDDGPSAEEIEGQVNSCMASVNEDADQIKTPDNIVTDNLNKVCDKEDFEYIKDPMIVDQIRDGYEGDNTTACMIKQEGIALLGKAGRDMVRHFISQTKPRVIRRMDAGRFDTTTFLKDRYRADVYNDKLKGTLEKAALAIALDNSSSMSGHQSYTAAMLLSGILHHADKNGIPTLAAGYTMGDQKVRSKGIVRDYPVRIDIIKRFEERYDARVMRRCCPLPDYFRSGTPDLDCLQWITPQLWAREEEKKVLFVICDGEPTAAGDELTDKLRASYKKYLEACKLAGIRVFGFGIQADISGYFGEDWAYVTASSLADTFIEKLRIILNQK